MGVYFSYVVAILLNPISAAEIICWIFKCESYVRTFSEKYALYSTLIFSCFDVSFSQSL